MSKACLRTAGLLALSVVAVSANPTLAATLTFPGAAPCNTTLQACLDGATSGDIVEIATNTANAEFLTVSDKSLTLRPAAGFTPQLAAVFFVATTTNVTANVNGLRFSSSVSGRLGAGGGNLVMDIRNNTIVAGDFRNAINIDDSTAAGTYGTKTVTIIGNTITRGSSFSGCASGVGIVGTSAGFNATIVGNTFSLSDLSQCGGIEAVVGGQTATAIIDRNRIGGSNYDYGIQVRNFGANVGQPGGLITAHVSNNLVTGQNGNVGAPGGIVVSADGNNSAVSVNVVNNTLANNRTGLLVSARTDLGGSISGGAFNNIVAFNSQTGIGINSTLPAFTNSNNLVFGNGGDSFTAGPGTRTGNPAFVNAAGGNYQLADTSDAIDRGQNSALPATFTLDLAGSARRAGNSIDIGAYESTFARAADASPAVPMLGGTALACLLISFAWLGTLAIRWRAN